MWEPTRVARGVLLGDPGVDRGGEVAQSRRAVAGEGGSVHQREGCDVEVSEASDGLATRWS